MKISVQGFIASLILLITLQSALADVFSYGKDKTVIGSLQTHTVKNEESLVEIARQFDLGYQEIVDANPEFDPFVPGKDAFIQIPTSWVLPDVTPYEGIIINLSEMRLFYFFKQKSSTLVMTLPIGIGREGFNTPVGKFSIVEKTVNPKYPGRPPSVPGRNMTAVAVRCYAEQGVNSPRVPAFGGVTIDTTQPPAKAGGLELRT